MSKINTSNQFSLPHVWLSFLPTHFVINQEPAVADDMLAYTISEIEK